MLQLYLICFSYHVETTLLKNRWTDVEPIVEAFLRDLEDDDIRIVAKIGLRGINTKDERSRFRMA